MIHRVGALFASIVLLSSLAATFSAAVLADAGNPILGTINASATFNPDGTVTVFVRGQWNWLSHGSDCNFDRAGTGVAIIWNDPTETGYTLSKNGVTADVGIKTKSNSWADPNPLDPTVHPVDRGNVPAGYTTAGTDYPAGQAFNDVADPSDYASFKAGCGREPLTATASKTGGSSCGDGSTNCADEPWGSWGYEKNGGAGYSHTFRQASDITTVCANFYDVHGGGKAGNNKFQLPNNAKEITVDGNGDNSIETNSFNVNNGANCITVTPPPPSLTVKKTVNETNAIGGDTLVYTITVTNTGPVATTENVTDDISPVVPQWGSLVSSTPAAAVTGGNQLAWNNQSFAVGQVRTYTYSVKLIPAFPAGTTTNLPNTVVVTHSNCIAGSADPDCSVLTTVVTQRSLPLLKVTKTPDAQSVVVGNPVGFTITVSSVGDDTATGVQFSDALPTLANAGINWAIDPAYAGVGTCGINGAPPSETLVCNFGDMPKNTSTSVHVTSNTTKPPAGTNLAACAITTETYDTNLDNHILVTSTNTQSAIAHTGICVTGTPHITVVKTPDAATVAAGSPVGYTITVTSDGVGTANAVQLSDPLPTLANVGINWNQSPAYAGQGTCGISGAPPTETLNCAFGDIPSGTSLSVHVTSNTTAPPVGTTIAPCQVTVINTATNLDNTVSITSSNAGSATAVTGICVTGNPHLTAVKTPDAQSVAAGNAVGFTMTVTNDGVGSASGVSLSDPLPTLAGVGINWSISPAVAGCSITGAVPTQTLNCTIGTLTQGASFSVHVTSPTSAPPAGQNIAACQTTVTNFATNLNNTVTITSTNAGGATAVTGTCVTGTPHVTVIKTPDAANVVAGSPVGFTITVSSDGVGTATAVNLNDPLPTLANVGINWNVSPAYNGPGTCGINGAPPAETLACAFGDMASGTSATIHVTSNTTAPPVGTSVAACQITIVNVATNLNNTATITSGNAGGGTANAGVCVVGNPHLTAVKTPDNGTVVVGNPVGFTMTVTNDGVGTANGVTLSDPLPTLAGVGINWSISPANAACSISGAVPTQTLNCNFGSLAQGASVSVHVTSTTTAPPAGTNITPCAISVINTATNLDNTVTITSSNAGGATAVTGICVTGTPHVTVTKVPDAGTVVAGNPVGFTIVVSSDGVGTANAVTLNDPLPTLASVGINWNISPAYAGPGTCGINGAPPAETLACSFGNMASGTSATIHVTSTTTAPPVGTVITPCAISVINTATNLDNTVTITSSNAGGGTAATGICVTGNPHLKVVKTPDAATVVAGNAVGFTMTVTNDGVGTANGVNLSDPLPTLSGLGINWSINPAVAGCSISGAAPTQTLNCNFGNIVQGASVSVHVTSTTTAPPVGVAITPCQISVINTATNLDNSVTITSQNAGGATAVTGICVIGDPHLKAVKTPDNTTVVAGSPVGFTITVTSDGIGTVLGVSLTDNLPTLASVGINWSISPAVAGCSITGAPPTQTLGCNIGDMPQGSTFSVHVTSTTTAPAPQVTITPCQIGVVTYATNLDNTVNITSQTGIGATAITGICVTGTPHVTVVKTPDNATVVAGNPVGFTMTVTSDGIGTANAVTLNDPLPTLANVGINWTISPAFGGPGTCGINGAPPSETLVCNFGDLAAGATASVHVSSNTTAPAVGVSIAACQITVINTATNLDNTVSITSSNAGSATAVTGLCVTGTPHVKVVKTPDNQTVVAGNPVGFTMTATSDGVGTATGVTLSDSLPTLAGVGINWSISPAYAGPGTCSITGAAPSQTLSCNFGDLAQGATASVHVTSTTTAPPAGTTIAPCQITSTNFATNLDNTVTITSQNAGSSTAITGTCVLNIPHIKVVKTPDAANVIAGNPVGFTITVTSDGVGTATGVTVNDPLPTLASVGINWSISPAYAGPGTCSITGAAPTQTLACNLGDLAAGSSASVHVTSNTTAPAIGTTITACTITTVSYATNLNNSVQVTSTNAASSTAITGICVTQNNIPVIQVVKSANPTSLPAGGGSVTYSYTVTNKGNVPLSNVSLVDDKCASVTFTGGDTNNDNKLDLTEAWTYTCTTNITVTTTNTALATGFYNGSPVTDTDQALVTVGVLVPDPKIGIVKAANPTTLPIGGGLVKYTYAVTNKGNVPLTNVTVVDDKCSPVTFVSGDTNGNGILDLTETWAYQCSTTITVTTVNTAVATGFYLGTPVTATDKAVVTIPVPTPTPTGSVKGATSPPKPHVTLPPTDSLANRTDDGSNNTGGTTMILILLAGIAAAVPVLAFGKKRSSR